jgi:hypothetical protein
MDINERNHIEDSVKDTDKKYCDHCGVIISGMPEDSAILDYCNGDQDLVCLDCWEKAERKVQTEIDREKEEEIK